ncbi:MAG: hypothetical protein J0626_03750, partial [Rhodospirillaceae bacterium]|nr:hypothetical protein [Rhodospirillaceae bacterium]
ATSAQVLTLMFGLNRLNTGGGVKDFPEEATAHAKAMRLEPQRGSEMATGDSEDHIGVILRVGFH